MSIETNARRKYNTAEDLRLLSQVERRCPLCARDLFYKKGSRHYGRFERAHIYPLNPTLEEVVLLEGVDRLSDDVNDIDNIIPLCKGCHGEFDTPRTREEYEQLYDLKKRLIDQEMQRDIWRENYLPSSLSDVLNRLYQSGSAPIPDNASLNAKRVEEKLGPEFHWMLANTIKFNVIQYFQLIKKYFSLLDRENSSNESDLISAHVKAYYLREKSQGKSKEEIFEAIISWIAYKTSITERDPVEAVASFFVQNCEVFE